MPCKVYDYLAAGLAVVSSLDGELAELLREQRIGLRYRAGSAASLADAIEQLASDRRLLGTLRANARRAAGQFERRVQYAKVARLLDGLVPAARNGGAVAGRPACHRMMVRRMPMQSVLLRSFKETLTRAGARYREPGLHQLQMMVNYATMLEFRGEEVAR